MIATPTCSFVEGRGGSGGGDSVFLLRFDDLHRHGGGSSRLNRFGSPCRGDNGRRRSFLPNAGSDGGFRATRE
jgi:hypothetical protein